jgi:hypothetical protein
VTLRRNRRSTKPDVLDADGFVGGDAMVASPELTMLREMASLIREYFDERNRPAVSWDGMPSVQDQKRRRERIVELLEAVDVRASRSAFSGIPRTENEPGEGVVRCAKCARWHSGVNNADVKTNLCEDCASVISSASPLSEEDVALVNELRYSAARAKVNVVLEVSEAAALCDLIARLSASAPSPEGAPAEPTLVVGFNRETGNPTVEARSVETSDFCAACVRGYCEDRYSIRECRGHWHVTMCGADLAIPGDPFASADIAQRAADAVTEGRDPGGEA